MNNYKELKVAALRSGTVIDHIPTESLFKVISVLKLEGLKSQITIGYNLDSGKLGKKGIIKITDKFLAQDEVNKVSLIAPKAKINIIRDYEVVEKMTLQYPDEILGAVKCINPKCITNHEPMSTKFRTLPGHPGMYVCHYCERAVTVNEMIIE